MVISMHVLQLIRKVAVEAAVVITGFLAGWSSHNISTGVVMAVALGVGVAVPVFRGDARIRPPHRRPS